jgi:excisionase family DNA binding protein
MDQWQVLIPGHHPGYIEWDDYLANKAKLAANRTNAGARPVREGHALCQGIISCGSCGRPMSTRYHRDGRGAYECHSRKDQQATPTCRSISAQAVDDAVAERLIAALNPEEVKLALAAADEVAGRRDRASRAAQLAVERARYDADRAERAFHAAEPENRLVGRTLETRWETKLAVLAEAEAALAQTRTMTPPLPHRDDLQALLTDLSRLWSAASTSARDRKRLLRTLIADITMLPETSPDKVGIGIRWHTGATDKVITTRPLPPGPAKRTPSAATEMIIRLGPDHTNDELVIELNAGGFFTGHGNPFDVKAVQWVRHVHHVQTPSPYATGEISVAEAAERLNVSASVIYYWIKTGQLTARRGPRSRQRIPWTDAIEADCRQRVADSVHLIPKPKPVTAGEAV